MPSLLISVSWVDLSNDTVFGQYYGALEFGDLNYFGEHKVAYVTISLVVRWLAAQGITFATTYTRLSYVTYMYSFDCCFALHAEHSRGSPLCICFVRRDLQSRQSPLDSIWRLVPLEAEQPFWISLCHDACPIRLWPCHTHSQQISSSELLLQWW